MNNTYIKNNINKMPKDRDDFVNQFEKMCEAFDISFTNGNNYKPMAMFLVELYTAMVKFKNSGIND